MSNYAANDYDAIHERLKMLREPAAFDVDVQWYEQKALDGCTPEYCYLPLSARAIPLFQHLVASKDRFIRWITVEPSDLRQRLKIPEDFVFEEIPRP